MERMRQFLMTERVNLLCFACGTIDPDREVGTLPEKPACPQCGANLLAPLSWFGTPIRDARCPLVCNVDARPVRRAGEIRDALERQLLAPVRWEQSMSCLLAEGAEGFVELGTGKVLRGLLRSIAREAPAWNVDDPESLQATLAGLGAASVPGGGTR